MRKGLIKVFIANVIFLLVGILSNFLLPKYLPVESYALIKTYTLYISYAGLFSLGYHDGLYLLYGGKKFDEIESNHLTKCFKNYIYYLTAAATVLFVVSYLLENKMLMIFAVAMIANNIVSFFRSLYQAAGEYGLYGKALNAEKLSVFIINVVLIFVFGIDNGYVYVIFQVIVGFVISYYLWLITGEKVHAKGNNGFSPTIFKENCGLGIALTLGNLSSSFFTGIDRWFVKILLGTVPFAMYSFAVSMEQVVNVFITPITVSMYNYFCSNHELETIKKIKRIVLIWGFAVISCAFPAKWILENFLQNYISANSVLFLLFAANAFYAVIKGIYVNVYKAEKKQNRYLYQMICMIVVAFIFDAFLYLVFKSMEAIAAGTLCTAIIWFLYCEISRKDLRFRLKEYIAIALILISYIYCGYRLPAIAGFFVYIVTGMIVGIVFMNDSVIYIITLIRDYAGVMIKKFK